MQQVSKRLETKGVPEGVLCRTTLKMIYYSNQEESSSLETTRNIKECQASPRMIARMNDSKNNSNSKKANYFASMSDYRSRCPLFGLELGSIELQRLSK